jgi:hypothetical protein
VPTKAWPAFDQQTIADIEQYGVSRLLDELATDLRDGSYRALPARRVFIPKPGREGAQRPLSIPTVRDRVVQAAMKIVIEPIFEADFLACSFGFRPKRSQHDALQAPASTLLRILCEPISDMCNRLLAARALGAKGQQLGSRAVAPLKAPLDQDCTRDRRRDALKRDHRPRPRVLHLATTLLANGVV